VTDVAPDGTSNVITGGSLVASQREVTTTPCGSRVEFCSQYSGGQITVPWHPFTYASSKPLQPNQIYDLQLEIFPTTAQLLPGHRLRVVVMSGDTPHRLDTASTLTGTATGGGLDTVYFGPGYPSRLYLGTAPAA
jgi:predicted acyl esterase